MVFDSDCDQLLEEALIRANLCKVIAEFFLVPPTRSFLKALAASPLFPVAVEPGREFGEIVQEFHNLFMVPTGPYVFPFESCYEGRTETAPGRLMGKPAGEVKNYYTHCGFEQASETPELPDHAGVEMSFLQALAEREANAWRRREPGQAAGWCKLYVAFYKDHASRWIPDLCAEVEKRAIHDYQRGFAQWITCLFREGTLLPSGNQMEEADPPPGPSAGKTNGKPENGVARASGAASHAGELRP